MKEGKAITRYCVVLAASETHCVYKQRERERERELKVSETH